MKKLKSAALASLHAVLAVTGSPASALDGEDVARRFGHSLAIAFPADDIFATVGSIAIEGTRVVLQGVTVSLPGSDDQNVELPVRAIVLDGVGLAEDGGYFVERVEIPATSLEFGPLRITLGEIAFDGLIIAGDATARPQRALLFDRLRAGPFSYSMNGSELVSVAGVTAAMRGGANPSEILYEQRVDRLRIDHADLIGAPAAGMIASLGIDEIMADIAVEAAWNTADGALSLKNLTVDLGGVGMFRAQLNAGGYTPEVAAAIDAYQSKPSVIRGGRTIAAYQDALEQLTLRAASLRVDDRGGVAKALALAGERRSVSPSEIAELMVEGLEAALAPVEPEALRSDIMTAARSFLQDRGSLRLAVELDAPLSFADLLRQIILRPADLLRRLNLSVAAK